MLCPYMGQDCGMNWLPNWTPGHTAITLIVYTAAILLNLGDMNSNAAFLHSR
jgi:hypothetical protein